MAKRHLSFIEGQLPHTSTLNVELEVEVTK